MKKFMLIVLLLMVMVAQAFSATLVSDPQASATGLYFEIWSNVKGLPEHLITITGTLVATKANQPDGSISYNLDELGPGSYNWYIRHAQAAYIYGPSNTVGGGKTYSVFIPFDFTKFGPVTDSIKGLKLVQ